MIALPMSLIQIASCALVFAGVLTWLLFRGTSLYVATTGAIVGCGAVAVLYAAIPSRTHRPDRTVAFDAEDPEMRAAIETAKRSLDDFIEAFVAPKAGQDAFLVKVVFVDGDQTEHIWVADLEIEGPRFRGVLANEPNTPSLRFKQVVEFDRDRITDWMYIDHGTLVGGYTTRLIRERESQGSN